MSNKSGYLDAELINEINNIFAPADKYESEIAIVTRVIDQHCWTIHICGSELEDFAKYCREVIDAHYKQHPEDRLTDIELKQYNLGMDNWDVERVFHYTARYAACHATAARAP